MSKNNSNEILNDNQNQFDLFGKIENQVEEELGNEDVEIIEPFWPSSD